MIASAQNATAIVFPRCEEGVELVTHYSIGLEPSGPTMYTWSGRFSTPISVVPGFTPSFPMDSCCLGFGADPATEERDGRVGDGFKRAFMEWFFLNAPIPKLGSGVLGSDLPRALMVAMHTADPGPSGNQSTSESRYRGYARVPIYRGRPGWSVLSRDE